jgi:methyltransferase
MTKDLIIANAIIAFYIIQRMTEVLISKDNERWLKENCHAVEVDKSEGIKMKIFHTFWFISLLLEINIAQKIQIGAKAIVIYSFLAICMGIRFYSIEKLKRFWTIKIFSLDRQELVTDGVYKFIRHPNYLVVIIEFVLLPLLFKAYLTMVIFSLLNVLVVSKRIKLEEETIMDQSNYYEKFKDIKKLIPYLFILILFVNPINAKEISHHVNNFEDAKKAEDYIKFEGASTKLGFITTGFDGYVKEFKVNYDLIDNQINKLEVTINTSTLDTDLGSRNEKMINSILEADKYPQIHAAIIDKVEMKNGDQIVNMIFTVKNQKLTRPVKIKIEKLGEHFLVIGTTILGLKELGLPDPSIVIAKVKDEFNLKFLIHL